MVVLLGVYVTSVQIDETDDHKYADADADEDDPNQVVVVVVVGGGVGGGGACLDGCDSTRPRAGSAVI